MSNSIEIRTPELPESVADAKVLAWHKSAGETVAQDENLADLETDKVVLGGAGPGGRRSWRKSWRKPGW